MFSKLPILRKSCAPNIFLTEDGEPVTFSLHPSCTHYLVHTLISSGGGVLINEEKPGVIPLFEEHGDNSDHHYDLKQYISVQFIFDCIEKKKMLDIEDYRLGPREVSKPPAEPAMVDLCKQAPARLVYDPEEDKKILICVFFRRAECRGTHLWQEMKEEGVTESSWQSMRSHYHKKLLARHKSLLNAATTIETGVEKPSDGEKQQQSASGDDVSRRISTRSGFKKYAPESAQAQASAVESAEKKPCSPTTGAVPKKRKEKKKHTTQMESGSPGNSPVESEKTKRLTRLSQLIRRLPRREKEVVDPASKRSAEQPGSKQTTGESFIQSGPSDADVHPAEAGELGALNESVTETLAVLKLSTEEFFHDTLLYDVDSDKFDLDELVGSPTQFSPEGIRISKSRMCKNLRMAQKPNDEALGIDEKNLEVSSSSSAGPSNQQGSGSDNATQDEEIDSDKLNIMQMMMRTNQNLSAVVKAMTEASRDFSLAIAMMTEHRRSGRGWTKEDNSLLRSGNPEALKQLVEKYGEKSVATRIRFIELLK